MKTLLRKFSKVWLAGLGGLLLGTLIILAIRFISYQPEDAVHYHANFALYINGQREPFSGPSYYEETTGCAEHDDITPGERAHMHGNINDVVHVEDQAVTWGHFFANLGWYVGKDFIQSSQKVFLPDEQNQLSLILNGQDLTGISSITNTVIKNEDRLLVSYGSEKTDELQKRYQSIPSTARKYNQEKDPQGCSGTESANFTDRLKHLF